MKKLLALLAASAPLLHAQSISPCVDSIERTGPGHYRFWMGYNSSFSSPVPLSSTLHGANANSTIPSTFEPGRHYAAFWVEGGDIVWQVGSRTATASMNFQSTHPREFLDEERPFVPGGVLSFDFRTVVENGENKHLFKWWRRNPATAKVPGGLAWRDGTYDWQSNPASGTVTYTLVLSDSDRDAALARLGLSPTPENDRRALVNEALRRVDTLSTVP